MSSDGKPGLTLLSLDGGRWENYGALTQIHVVEDILQKYEVDHNLEEGSARLPDVFDLVVGTGIGGLVGCMLGPLRMSTNEAKQAYLRIHESNFLAGDKPSQRAEALKGALRGVLDSGRSISLSKKRMNSLGELTPTCKFAVTAMTAANLSQPFMLQGYPGRNSRISCTLLEALLATLSDAQMLPPVAIGESISEFFVATTTGRCNPTEALLEEIPSIFSLRDVAVIVSIGSGRLNPVSLGRQGDFVSAVLDLAKSCHAVAQNMESRFSGHPGLFVRLNVDGFDRCEMLHPGEVISHSRAYLAKEEIRRLLDGLLYSLKHRPKRLGTSGILGLQPGILDRIDNTLNSILSAEEACILEKLNISTDAPFTSHLSGNVQRQPCTPGTRIAILQRLLDCATAHELDLNNSLFWLYGLAGTGKTTILRDICERLQRLNILASSYFCSIQLSSGDARHLVPTIARHLASRSKTFKAALILQLQQDPDLFFATLKPQFEYLLCNPWKVAAHQNVACAARVVVIDALDECDRGEEFLSLLLDAIDDGQLQGIQFIVSSRPVPRLLKRVRAMRPDSPQVSLHEIPKEEVNGDIRRYLEANLFLPSPRIDQLVARADGLFIYASTLVKYLTPTQPLAHIELERRLEKVLAQTLERSSINPLYKQIVDIALSLDDDEVMQTRWSILHAILCAAEPPSADVVAGLLGVDSQVVTALVDSLYSVLFTAGVGGPIYIFHASFHDFIVSSIDGKFGFNASRTHSILAQACLVEMNKSLRFNVCHLESSFIPDADLNPPLEQRILTHMGDFLVYASRHWWLHVKRCDEKSQSNIFPRIERVLQAKGIYWIEAMSLLEDIRGCKEVLAELSSNSSIVQMASAISQLALQTGKLVSLFNTLPVKITSHLYLSCLALVEKILEHNLWRDQFLSLPQVLSQQRSGNQYCQVIVDVGAPVYALALSSNGKHIVTGPSDCRVRIWDAESGMQLLKLKGHTSSMTTVAFSSDGKRIISDSVYTVRIWDAESGMQLRNLQGHTDFVNSVGFSPDGKCIVSGSNDTTVRIWDANSGMHLQKLQGHTSCVYSVALSPDGKRIISGSLDRTVRIWDAESGMQLRKLEGHRDNVSSVGFSPDGKCIVSGSNDTTVRIWDTDSGMLLRELQGHTHWVSSVAFSPDGKSIVSGSCDKTIRIWDVESGMQLWKLEGHGDNVNSVGFSPDGKRIISGSPDCTVRIWDTGSGTQIPKLQGHRNTVNFVCFSPDGKRIISGSDDSTVRIWDAESGMQLRKLEGHGDNVNSVGFSSDGKRIVSGSLDRTVRTWDANSGTQLQKLQGHTSCVVSVALSLDGKRIVSGSLDGSVRIWDAESGMQLRNLQAHTDIVNSVGFSPDGKCIVSGSSDTTVRIWDTDSGMLLRELQGHTHWVNSVAFSPDGKCIVSGSSDNTVCISDAKSGMLLRELHGHTHWVNCVAVSPDGKRVVSGSLDRTVRIWDAESGMQLQNLEGHTHWVNSVAFSPDGKSIISGSQDKTIRIWDIDSGKQLRNRNSHIDSVCSVVFSADIKRVRPAGLEVSIPQHVVGNSTTGQTVKLSTANSLNLPRSFLDQPSPSNAPRVPASQIQNPFPLNTLVMSQTSASLYCRNDGWLVTSREETGKELLILWIPPYLRPIDPSILLVISQDGFNSIDLAGCVFGEGWEQCYTGES
ncbi:WD40-repeat-containing domain protein [Flagelloscypha sp. PMI_526]|nr:WD40-repeat-containing domain protein [Flagelloscypha sp. PMI_526]